MLRPMNIRIFLVEGTPKGMRTAEIVGWTGVALVCPRSKISEFGLFEHANKPAVYLLIGEDDDGQPTVYIGETESAMVRVLQHAKDPTKGFWNYAVAFASKDENLTKAHVAYLEAKLIQMAKASARAKVHNPNHNIAPKGLPAADRADMENFVEHMQILLPALGVTVLETVSPNVKLNTGPTFELRSAKAYATAKEADDNFIVLKGSMSRGPVRKIDSYRSLRESLINKEVLVKNEASGLYEFTQDYAFASPSAASAIIVGGNDNGRTSWKVFGTLQSYADWQAASVPNLPVLDS
jgi:hypothetical protein